MKKMNIPLMAALLALSIVVCPVLYFAVGPTLDATKFETLKILVIIAACSAAFCFIVGEATGNNDCLTVQQLGFTSGTVPRPMFSR